ncbi:hypothetical protein MRB53_034292 [Persea americana]|uniref:Uncharacterized protein n=1 Tax=Persea americana TaxID=3435 RepID=A0ACC2KXD8_PERAE|nr:hypothetical protein MRB53_034292 [Persea americana]
MEGFRHPMEFRSKRSPVPSTSVVRVREVPNFIPTLDPNGRPTLANAAAWHGNQHLLLGHPSTNHPFEMAPPPFPMYKTLNGHRMPRAPPPSQSLQTPLNPLNNPMGVVGQGTQTMQPLNLQEDPFYSYMEPTPPQQMGPTPLEDEMTWVPQMPSNFDPSSLMKSETPKKGKAPMHSVYDPLIQWRGLSSDPHLHLQNPTLSGTASPGPSNMPSLGEAFAYAASPKTPSIWQDAMTWVPQMQSNFDPSSLMQSEPPKEGKAPMHSVYDLSLLWTGLPNDPQLRSYNPTLGEPTSAGFSNLSYLANASASAVTPKEKVGTIRISKPTFMEGNQIQNKGQNQKRY